MSNHKPIWPPEPPELIENVLGTNLTIYKEMFGALSQDSSSPYSRISVAKSSFSLDPFVGCPARCAYCVSASSYRDLDANSNRNPTDRILPTRPKQLFSGKELVDALVIHPAFLPNKSIVSVGTGSTESFLPVVEEQTWQIMKRLADLHFSNPVWIVTKMGICDQLLQQWIDRFEFVRSKGIEIVISITYSAAPSWMEPYQGDRFKNVQYIKQTGVYISHHLRPILRGINDSQECVRTALGASKGLAGVICIGGLRPDPGIHLAWKHVNGLDPNLLPRTTEKDLPEYYLDLVMEELQYLEEDIPVVKHSSQAISVLLGIPDYNLHKYRTNDNRVFLVVPFEIQRNVHHKTKKSLRELISNCAKEIKLNDIDAHLKGTKIQLSRDLSYQEHQLLIHTIGHNDILP